MSSFSVNGVVFAEYAYNHLGQQVVNRQVQNGQTIHSVHDAAGQRIAEYLYNDAAGTSTLIREYIWANAQIVGVVENGALYYVRTDHIGRPVFATDDMGTKVWTAIPREELDLEVMPAVIVQLDEMLIRLGVNVTPEQRGDLAVELYRLEVDGLTEDQLSHHQVNIKRFEGMVKALGP